MNRSSSHECACAITAVSSSVRSDAYATMHACSSGSSGSLPLARNHTSCSGSRARGSGSSQRGSSASACRSGGRADPVDELGREPIGVRLEPLADRRQRLGIGRVGHRVLVLGPGFGDVERRRQVEDRAAVLDRDDPAGREAAAVADAVDVVDDRDRGSPGRRKYACSECTWPSGRRCGPAATSAWPATWPPNTRWRSSSGLTPAEQVHLELLELEQVDEIVERRAHDAATYGSPARRSHARLSRRRRPRSRRGGGRRSSARATPSSIGTRTTSVPRSATIFAEVALVHRVDRLDPEAGRDHAVVRGRAAAAQHVPERVVRAS